MGDQGRKSADQSSVEALLERIRELEESNRNLQSYADRLAHDMKAPARQISMSLNLYLMSLEGEDPDHEALELAQEAATKLQNMITETLASARSGFEDKTIS